MRASQLLVFLALLVAAAGCTSSPKCGNGDTSCSSDGKPNAPGTFESDLPGGASNGLGGPSRGSAEAGDAAGVPGANAAPPSAMSPNASPTPTAPADGKSDSDNGGAERAIVEADIIQLNGDRLYALSRRAGLAVVNAADPKNLQLIGRYRELPGTPFEMYLQDDVAILMFSDWGQYAATEDGKYSWVTTSKVVALDVANPASIQKLGTFDVPGSISDSRVVGDVMYVVGYESGYCWRCERDKPTTTISSLNVADPRAIKKVDELRYGNVNDRYSWQRSITVTNQRMYVAGPEYGQNGPVGSLIQVVDISDPNGDLVEGGKIQARGQISSRWQMDEFNGVFRVVSQPGQWNTTERPMLQTFKVVSSREFQSLARLEIVIPARETLRSARFDGERGYLITAEQKDPLFTLDLSDPANPKQVGELEMPGFVYHMEPRGDRVLGLGFDQGNPEGSITVSVFDVSNIATPKMLSRVNFGGDWGSLPEDQDRIHKVFRILEDENLILVPFSGYRYTDKRNYCGKSIGGVQLIDYANDALTLRGSAPSTGEARRALVHNQHLLSVSDDRVEAFDISNRSAPKAASDVVMANTVAYAARLDGDLVARVTRPAWDNRWFVEVASASNAEDVNDKLGELSLSSVLSSGEDECNEWWNIQSYHTSGSQLFLLYEGYRYARTGNSNERELGVIVVDAKDPAKPKVAAQKSWITTQSGEPWYVYYGDYQYGGFGRTQQYVWHGTTLAFLEQRSVYNGTTYLPNVRLRVIDLSDLENITASTLGLDASQAYSGLIADGDRLLTSRYQRPTQSTTVGSARFYVDSFDVSDPSKPKALPSVNVPGVLVHYDAAAGRAITSELKRSQATTTTAEECYRRYANAEFTYTNPNTATQESTGRCMGYLQALHLVELRSDVAVLEDTLQLEENENIAAWSAGDGRLFATVSRGGRYYYARGPLVGDCFGCGGASPLEPAKLLVLGGFDSGELEIGRIEVETGDDTGWWGFWGTPPIHAHGQKALLISNGDAAVVDASNLQDVHVAKTVPLFGSVSSVEIQDDVALLALQDLGAQWIEL